jgi:hypothetical protein
LSRLSSPYLGDIIFDSKAIYIKASVTSMRFSVTAAVLAATSFITGTLAHNIQLKAHSRECFHETLHVGDKMTVTFQVGDREFQGAGNLDVDFFVCCELL